MPIGTPISSAVDLLSGIPSVVYGLLGMIIIVPLVNRRCKKAYAFEQTRHICHIACHHHNCHCLTDCSAGLLFMDFLV